MAEAHEAGASTVTCVARTQLVSLCVHKEAGDEEEAQEAFSRWRLLEEHLAYPASPLIILAEEAAGGGGA